MAHPHTSLAGVAAAVLLLTGACAIPVPTARSGTDYAKKAGHTAEEVASAVDTALLALHTAARGKLPNTTLAVIVNDAVDDANGAADTFASIQPRGNHADELREELLPMLDDATSALEDTVILVRRGRTTADDLRDVEQRLDEASQALSDFEDAQP